MKQFLLFSILFFLTFNSLLAQTDSSRVIITLKNNTYFTGHIEQEDSVSVTFRTQNNIQMIIPKQEIESIRRKPTKSTRKFYAYDDPNDTRLFFAPTSRTLKQGDGYIADYWVFFPFVAVGAFDRLVLSGGVTLFPGAKQQLFYLAPKVGLYQGELVGVAAGILYMNITSLEEDGVGIAYGVSTIGNSDRSVTVGLGWAYSGKEVEKKPIVLLGGEVRLSQSIKLISENWIFPDTDFSLLSLGIRFFGRQLATDLALMYPYGAEMGDGFPFFPWLSFAYNF